jgi:hypothetical protein
MDKLLKTLAEKQGGKALTLKGNTPRWRDGDFTPG